MFASYQPLTWLGDRLRILDQTRLPLAETYLETSDFTEVAQCIRELKVRGAPAIGVAGAYGIALGALSVQTADIADFRTRVGKIIDAIISTRPTARNLFWAAERMAGALLGDGDVAQVKSRLVREAVAIHEEERDCSRRVSEIGSQLLSDGDVVLTHCNTGPLATTGYGTALGVILLAFRQGKRLSVLVDETRPLLQGSRLTAWELKKEGVPFRLITDSMAGSFMASRAVTSVFVGADTIAANGDTANKIGTYSLAVLARAHRIPFYVAAPTSTIDHSIGTGKDIKIEQRRPEEVTHIGGVPIAPEGVDVANPAFDVTPAGLITAIVTERGIIKRPYLKAIRELA